MSVRTAWETLKTDGGHLVGEVRKIIDEGNARSIVIKQDGRKIAEFPLSVGVVGAVLAPVLAAVGALAAVLTKCTVEVERVVPEATVKPKKPATRSRRRRA